MVKCKGGCHCGRVEFEVEVPLNATVFRCNCSVCQKTAYLHLIVSREAFRLLQGEESLLEYRFNTGVARHLFCRICGIKSFYVPRSHPDSISANLNCIDLSEDCNVRIKPFDGRNWSKSLDQLGAQ